MHPSPRSSTWQQLNSGHTSMVHVVMHMCCSKIMKSMAAFLSFSVSVNVYIYICIYIHIYEYRWQNIGTTWGQSALKIQACSKMKQTSPKAKIAIVTHLCVYSMGTHCYLCTFHLHIASYFHYCLVPLLLYSATLVACCGICLMLALSDTCWIKLPSLPSLMAIAKMHAQCYSPNLKQAPLAKGEEADNIHMAPQPSIMKWQSATSRGRWPHSHHL